MASADTPDGPSVGYGMSPVGALEQMRQALKFWTAGMVGMGVLVFVTTPTYMGGMPSSSLPWWVPAAWPPWLPNIVWVTAGWFIGMMVLLVAGRLGAFRPGDPRSAAEPGATTEVPQREQAPPS